MVYRSDSRLGPVFEWIGAAIVMEIGVDSSRAFDSGGRVSFIAKVFRTIYW